MPPKKPIKETPKEPRTRTTVAQVRLEYEGKIRDLKDKIKDLTIRLDDYSQPIQKDASNAWKNKYGKIAIIVAAVGLFALFTWQGCKRNAYNKDRTEIDSLQRKANALDSGNKVLEQALQEWEIGAERVLQEADEATKERIQSETSGADERQKAKIYNDEFTKRVTNPKLSDNERRRARDEIMQSRHAARNLYANDSTR